MPTPTPQQTTTPTVLRSGESAVPAGPLGLKDKNARTFHHMVPGARFIMPDGLEVQFLGGIFTTTDPDIIKELSAVADKPASMIYTESDMPATVNAMTAKAAADAVQ
jgi:hypothetical protein